MFEVTKILQKLKALAERRDADFRKIFPYNSFVVKLYKFCLVKTWVVSIKKVPISKIDNRGLILLWEFLKYKYTNKGARINEVGFMATLIANKNGVNQGTLFRDSNTNAARTGKNPS